jgi:hypothetical protein
MMSKFSNRIRYLVEFKLRLSTSRSIGSIRAIFEAWNDYRHFSRSDVKWMVFSKIGSNSCISIESKLSLFSVIRTLIYSFRRTGSLSEKSAIL